MKRSHLFSLLTDPLANLCLIYMINKGIIMKKLVCFRIHQFRACLTPLGKISCRPLFGGYSLAIDNTVFAMMAEGEIYLGFVSRARSTAWRIKTRFWKCRRMVVWSRWSIIILMKGFGRIAICFFIYQRCHYRALAMKNIGSGIPGDWKICQISVFTWSYSWLIQASPMN